MKRGKMIKMVATGTGARNVIIGWLLCLGAWGFLLQVLLQTSILRRLPCRLMPERRENQHLTGSQVGPARADMEGCRWMGVLMVQAGRELHSLRLSAALNRASELRGSLLPPSPSHYPHTYIPLWHLADIHLHMETGWQEHGALRAEGYSFSVQRVPSRRHSPL